MRAFSLLQAHCFHSLVPSETEKEQKAIFTFIIALTTTKHTASNPLILKQYVSVSRPKYLHMWFVTFVPITQIMTIYKGKIILKVLVHGQWILLLLGLWLGGKSWCGLYT